MSVEPEPTLDFLWKEYSLIFQEFDDLTLARWMAQTLGQFEGKAWRLSHPLMAAYRLAAQVAHDRQIWFKRLASPPHAFAESPCCRAPALPLLTRDVQETGLVCQHCDETLLRFDDLPQGTLAEVRVWASEYGVIHAVAHWDDRRRKAAGDYDRAFETAAEKAEALLARAGGKLAPQLLEYYPAVVWEDQDECLEVRPEDVRL
jgi:hypothetical protein